MENGYETERTIEDFSHPLGTTANPSSFQRVCHIYGNENGHCAPLYFYRSRVSL